MTEEPYSKREIDMITKPIIDHLDKQDEILSRIEQQTLKTNGRVNKLEEKTEDYTNVKKTVNGLVNYKWWLAGAIAVFMILGGTIYVLVYNSIDTKISNGIDSAFDSRFSKIQVIQ